MKSDMVMVLLFGMMVIHMRANGMKTTLMVMEQWDSKKVIFILEILKVALLMAKAVTYGNQQERDIKETGSMVLRKVMESTHGWTVIDSAAILNRENEKDMDDTSLLKVANLKDNIKMMRKMELAFSLVNKEASIKGVSKMDTEMGTAH